VDPRVGLDDVEKRKSLTVPELDSSVVQPIASRYSGSLPVIVRGALLSAHLGLIGWLMVSSENH
jgi:hypothetical protein